MIYQNVSNIKYLKSYIDGYTKRGWILVEKKFVYNFNCSLKEMKRFCVIHEELNDHQIIGTFDERKDAEKMAWQLDGFNYVFEMCKKSYL